MTEGEARRRVILAMCPERVCRTCGEPSRRVVAKTPEYETFSQARSLAVPTSALQARSAVSGAGPFEHHNDSGARGQLYETVGFTDCGHDDWRPGVWLDPFAVAEIHSEEMA